MAEFKRGGGPRRRGVRVWRSPALEREDSSPRPAAEALFGLPDDPTARLVAALRQVRRAGAAGRADYDAERHRALARRLADWRRDRRRAGHEKGLRADGAKP